jgi:hypothetical protein
MTERAGGVEAVSYSKCPRCNSIYNSTRWHELPAGVWGCSLSISGYISGIPCNRTSRTNEWTTVGHKSDFYPPKFEKGMVLGLGVA